MKKKKVIFVRKGELTKEGVELVRELGKKGLKVNEIQKKLPQKISIRTIAAHIAIGNRKSNRFFMSGHEITEYGKKKIREFASQGLNTKSIQSIIPATVPERKIRGYVAAARRAQ